MKGFSDERRLHSEGEAEASTIRSTCEYAADELVNPITCHWSSEHWIDAMLLQGMLYHAFLKSMASSFNLTTTHLSE